MREWPSDQEGQGHVARSHDHRDQDQDASRVVQGGSGDK